MKVTVEVSNDCDSHWTPDESLCKQWIHAAFEAVQYTTTSSVSLCFVSQADSAELNSKFRGKASATNVLSFPSEFPENLTQALNFQPLGDIVICPALVEREAMAQEKELQAHWAHLLIHGTLHLLGYDHERANEARKMEQLEISALQSLGISDPYLIGC